MRVVLMLLAVGCFGCAAMAPEMAATVDSLPQVGYLA